MKTSEVFEFLNKLKLNENEAEAIEVLEESFTDITPEGFPDYLRINDYFDLIERNFDNEEIITSCKLKIYVNSIPLGKVDLFFLDGLLSLSRCLEIYGGKNDFLEFKKWFSSLIKNI